MKEIIVSREKLLKSLEEVQHGLSKREIVDQASCFVFRNGRVHTFNQEVYCSARSGLPKELRGAVQAERMIAMLRRIDDENLTMSFTDSTVAIKAKNRETVKFPFQKEILLPFDEVEIASKWRPINKDFIDAIGIVAQSASQDQSEQIASCIHIHPKFVEASDGRQFCRYRLKTGVKESFLVRRDSVKFITSFDITEIAESDNCLHFRTAAKTIISARLYKDAYRDQSAAIKEEGEPIFLPPSLKEIVEKTQIITEVDKDNNFVTFDISEEKIRVSGSSTAGEYSKEYKKAKYKGKPIRFKVPPKLMIEVLRRHTDCEITPTMRLKIKGGKFVFIAAMTVHTEEKKKEEKGEHS